MHRRKLGGQLLALIACVVFLCVACGMAIAAWFGHLIFAIVTVIIVCLVAVAAFGILATLVVLHDHRIL